MRPIIFSALLLVIGMTFVNPCFGQISNTEKEIIDLENEMNAAYAANDLPTYFRYYADDLTQWLPEARTDLPQYRKEWTEFIRSGGKVESDHISDMHIQVGPSADTAVASYLLSVRTRNPKGNVADEDFHESDVWFKRNGQWKVVHLHYSAAPKKK